ncbi:gp138.3 [Caviid betaherpesvirus 2]|uniref:Gp138.3 n=1 Tax=Guinea pig cytomegalovirus (strain 22122) TaxID=103920 RepID=L7ZAL3_GPCMV|nr:gp138.3 [Caviid betaherpesvirus 2]AGE11592.1 gp138.3 [Caviid betaherpesvirus 2]AIL83977.1 gp138.3 [BAC cloning vector GPN13BACdenovo_preserved(MM)]
MPVYVSIRIILIYYVCNSATAATGNSNVDKLYLQSGDRVTLSCASFNLSSTITIRSRLCIFGDEYAVSRSQDSGSISNRTLLSRLNATFTERIYSTNYRIEIRFTFQTTLTGVYECIVGSQPRNSSWLTPIDIVEASSVVYNDTVWINCTITSGAFSGYMFLHNETGPIQLSRQQVTVCSQGDSVSYMYNSTSFPGKRLGCVFHPTQCAPLTMDHSHLYLESSEIKSSIQYSANEFIISCSQLSNNGAPSMIYWDLKPCIRDLFHSDRRDVCDAKQLYNIGKPRDGSMLYTVSGYSISTSISPQFAGHPTILSSTTLQHTMDLGAYGMYYCGICYVGTCHSRHITLLPMISVRVERLPDDRRVNCSIYPITLNMVTTESNHRLHITQKPPGLGDDFQTYTNSTLTSISRLHPTTNISDVICVVTIGTCNLTRRAPKFSLGSLGTNSQGNLTFATTPHVYTHLSHSGTTSWLIYILILLVAAVFIVVICIFIRIMRDIRSRKSHY